LSTVQAFCGVAGCAALAIKHCIAITGFGLCPSDEVGVTVPTRNKGVANLGVMSSIYSLKTSSHLILSIPLREYIGLLALK
jgi:hypothetical protein